LRVDETSQIGENSACYPNHQLQNAPGEFMKRTLTSVFFAALATLVAGNALAQDELLTKHNCTACHSNDKKIVGPAYADVATKYKDKKDAETYLAKKVKEGSTGVWGAIPMPANAGVPDEDLKKLVKTILATKAK
jgi:cytochrome c